jgi:RNA polymerase sigma-70 factor (family 1)
MASKDYSDYNVLIKSLSERDVLAFDYLYNSLRTKLFALALYMLQDEDEAKDLVQELFIDFWEKKRYQQVTVTIEYYLIKAIKNRALNQERRKPNSIPLNNFLSELLPAENTLSIDNQELKRKLDHAIAQLSPTASKVFQMHYVEKLSYEEISGRLGISKSTISTHMDRALKKLRIILKDE